MIHPTRDRRLLKVFMTQKTSNMQKHRDSCDDALCPILISNGINNSHQKGFTLLEILLSITILAVMGSIGSISFSSFRRDRQLELAASDITYMLRRAQSSAIAQENSNGWGVHFHNTASGADTFSTFYGDSYATGTIISSSRLSSFLEFLDPPASTTKNIIFAKATGIPNASTTITINLAGSPSSSRTIRVNIAGQISY